MRVLKDANLYRAIFDLALVHTKEIEDSVRLLEAILNGVIGATFVWGDKGRLDFMSFLLTDEQEGLRQAIMMGRTTPYTPHWWKLTIKQLERYKPDFYCVVPIEYDSTPVERVIRKWGELDIVENKGLGRKKLVCRWRRDEQE